MPAPSVEPWRAAAITPVIDEHTRERAMRIRIPVASDGPASPAAS